MDNTITLLIWDFRIAIKIVFLFSQLSTEAIASLVDKVNKLSEDVARLQEENKQQEEEIEHLKKTLPEKNNDGLPSFYAYLLTDRTITSGQTKVSFDATRQNEGGHFSTTTYSFTCPIEGHYYFSWTIDFGSIENHDVPLPRIELRKNNSELLARGVVGHHNRYVNRYTTCICNGTAFGVML